MECYPRHARPELLLRPRVVSGFSQCPRTENDFLSITRHKTVIRQNPNAGYRSALQATAHLCLAGRGKRRLSGCQALLRGLSRPCDKRRSDMEDLARTCKTLRRGPVHRLPLFISSANLPFFAFRDLEQPFPLKLWPAVLQCPSFRPLRYALPQRGRAVFISNMEVVCEMPDSPGLDTGFNMPTTRRNPPHRLHGRRNGGGAIEPVTGMPGICGPVIRSTRIRAPVPPQAPPVPRYAAPTSISGVPVSCVGNAGPKPGTRLVPAWTFIRSGNLPRQGTPVRRARFR